jgi:surface antigen
MGFAALAGLALGGCGMSFPIASLVPDDGPETTSGVRVRAISPLSADLGPEDWRRAKGALALALDPQGSGAAVSWDNPDSGLKGSFTPLGGPFVKNDEICRAFQATITGRLSPVSVKGTGCRPSGGDWSIHDVKAAKKPA